MGFGDSLRAAREMRGLTQQQIADSMGITKSTYCGYETGKRQPDVQKIKQLSIILNVPADILLETGHGSNNSFSVESSKFAQEYTKLDVHGKRIVDSVLAEESRRMYEELAEKQKKQLAEAEHSFRVIPLFGSSFAAGRGEPDFGNMWEDYSVAADSPADFAIRINGDSMEPYLHDGSIALGRRETPRDGDVAALLLDGEFLVKQICEDSFGNLHLFSLNRKRNDLDITLMHDSERALTCFGTIIMSKRVQLPVD